MFSHNLRIYVILLSLLQTVLSRRDCFSENVVSGVGTGRTIIKTTTAVIRLGVEVDGKLSVNVQKEVTARSAQLVTFLRQQNVRRLKTARVTLLTRFNFLIRPPRRLGFRGINIVSFTTPISKAGLIMDGSVRNGASRIENIQFLASPIAMEKARSDALRKAVEISQAEAHIVAKASGNRLGGVLNIRVTDSFFPQTKLVRNNPVPLRSLRRGGFTPIIGGETTVTARVSIAYDTY